MVFCGFNLGSPLALSDTVPALKDTLQLQEYGYADFLPPSQGLTLLLKKVNKRKAKYLYKDNVSQLHLWHLVSSAKFRLGGDIVI